MKAGPPGGGDAGEPLEIEVKVAVGDPAAARAKLLAAGASPKVPRLFEDNVLFDFADRKLANEGKLLRVRRVGDRSFLTLKAPPPPGQPDGLKVLSEREIGLAGEATSELEAIVAGLGLRPIYRYQKYREELHLGDVVATIDETPVGCFVELEGDSEGIRDAARALGWDESCYITKSYRQLHREWCRSHGLGCGDMVFDDPSRGMT